MVATATSTGALVVSLSDIVAWDQVWPLLAGRALGRQVALSWSIRVRAPFPWIALSVTKIGVILAAFLALPRHGGFSG